MGWERRRIVQYLVLLAVTTIAFTLVYQYGMATWEGRPRPLYRAFEVVLQTFTTTGYGEDAPWLTPQMNILMVVMQLTGIGLILTAVDVFVVPWLRSALSPSPPTATPDVTDHVIICTETARTEAFRSELKARNQAYVVVEPDEDQAIALHERDTPVVYGDPESTDVLERAGLERARAVVTDAEDATSASIVLAAREVAPDVKIVTVLERRGLGQYHHIAGADEVLSPRQLLGENLAGEVPTAVTTSVEEGIEIGTDLELVEISVRPDSRLCDERFENANLRAQYGVDVVGAWFNGDFESPVDPDAELDADTTLLVVGEPESIADLREAGSSAVREFGPHHVVIAGYGETGSTAAAKLANTNTAVTVLDRDDGDGVDVVGDACDPETLREAGVDDASALILAVSDDTAAVLATLIARDLNPDLDIVVRATEVANVEKLTRAGADYVQSLPAVSGRMMAATVFEDETVLAYDREIEVVRLPAGGLAGRTLAEADVRAETGCTIAAVERGGRTLTDLEPDRFQFAPDDAVVLVGTDESVSRFEERFVD